MSRLTIQPTVDRETYFRFKSLSQSLGVPVGKALEELMRDALERAGIEIGLIRPYSDVGRHGGDRP